MLPGQDAKDVPFGTAVARTSPAHLAQGASPVAGASLTTSKLRGDTALVAGCAVTLDPSPHPCDRAADATKSKLEPRSMRVHCAVASVLALSLLPSTPAFGQLDVERFKPAVTHDGWVNAEGAGIRDPSDPFEFALLANFQHSPLVIVDQSGEVADRFVTRRVGIDLIASTTVAGPVAIGVDFPFFVAQKGDFDPSPSGVGDLRIVPKLRLWDDRESVGVALLAEVRAPTHAGDFSGAGHGIVLAPRVAVEHRFARGFRFGLNAGLLWRERTRFHNVDAGSEATYALGVGYRFGGLGGKTRVVAEVNGAVGLRDRGSAELPLEVLGLLGHRPDPLWELVLGPGVGIVPGYGVPTYRVFAGARFAPTFNDSDYDTVPDHLDACPRSAEDLDRDEDHDGCPEEDPDADGDGVRDRDDRCPLARETINGIDDEDGCPDSGVPNVIYEEGELKVLDSVQFDHASANISTESFVLLDQVALTIKANPRFKRVSIEGHTDATGPDHANYLLSWQRAHAVRRYLIRKGVSPHRLTVKGHGSRRPRVAGDRPEAQARNRRVEFIVQE